jgi:formate hydrogenlyase transcriptional activator
LRTMQATGGRIGGPYGAAAKLGLKRTSLITKMKKLGIYHPRSPRIGAEFDEEEEQDQN